MGRISFENYGKKALQLDDYTLISGRYKVQEEAVRDILNDVMNKLDLNASDSVLEIGCGIGNLLIPISFVVKKITGIDHQSCLVRLKSRFCDIKNICLIPGNFFDVSLKRTFDKILCYSVLHYLADREEVFMFIRKALELLSPGGRVLFGDIPNSSAKRRFIGSNSGMKFSEVWKRLTQNQKHTEEDMQEDNLLVQFDDNLVLEILEKTRNTGCNSYVLSQPISLPFGHTREDILIIKPD